MVNTKSRLTSGVVEHRERKKNKTENPQKKQQYKEIDKNFLERQRANEQRQEAEKNGPENLKRMNLGETAKQYAKNQIGKAAQGAKDYGKKQLGKGANYAKNQIANNPRLNKLANAAGNASAKVKERVEAIKKKKAEFDAETKAIKDRAAAIRKKFDAAKRIQNALNDASAAKEEIKRKIKQAIIRFAIQTAASITGGSILYLALAILIIILIIIIIQAAESLCSNNPLFDFVCSLAGF